MKSADRKLALAFVLALAVIAFEFAWFLFVGPIDHGPELAAKCSENCDVPWWASAVAWTCFFTFVLTLSSCFMWWETRRLASGAEDQATDNKAAINAAKRSADAAQTSADAAVAGNRAWLTLLVKLEGPLSFSGEGWHCVSLPISVWAENIGRSPATKVFVMSGVGLEAVAPRMHDGLREAQAMAENEVHNRRTFSHHERTANLGETIFPGEKLEAQHNSWAISKDYLESVIRDGDGARLVNAYLCISASYFHGGNTGYTNVSYAVERRQCGEDGFPLPWNVEEIYATEDIALRKLPYQSDAD